MKKGSDPVFGVVVAAATALACWLVWPAFSPGHIANLDAPRHLLRSLLMTHEFLPSGHVDGWSPWWYLGAQLFLFQSYGYFLLIGATSLLLGPFFSVEQVFKVFFVLPLVLLPLATASMALRLGASRRAAAAAALSSLVFSSPYGYGASGLFAVGLLLQAAGIIGFAIAWPMLLDLLLGRSRSTWPVALVVAGVLLCHFITGNYLLAASGLVALGVSIHARDPQPLLRYLLLVAVVLLLAGHALFPSLQLHELSGAVVGWKAEDARVLRFLSAQLFGTPLLGIAALLAAAWTALRGAPALRITAIVFFATGIFASAKPSAWEPELLSTLLDSLVRPRALPYAALLQVLFAGIAIDLLLVLLEAIARRAGRAAWAIPATPLALAGLLMIAWPELQQDRRSVRTQSMLFPRSHSVYRELVGWLRENVQPPAILALPRTLLPFEAAGARSMYSLINIDTGLMTLGGDQAELWSPTNREMHVDLERLHVNAARQADLLRLAGVSWVVISDHVRDKMSGSAEFEKVFQFGRRPQFSRSDTKSGKRKERIGFAIFRLRGGGERLHARGLRFELNEAGRERFGWTVAGAADDPEAAQTGPRVANAALNWHPHWRATVDGEPVPTRRNRADRVSFEIPSGARTVTLEFVRPLSEKAWNALSALMLVLVLAAWWRERGAGAGSGRVVRAGEKEPAS